MLGRKGRCGDEEKLAGRRDEFLMTGADLTRLQAFTQAVNWTLMFDLNVLKRKGRAWDPDNARKFCKHSIFKPKGFYFEWEESCFQFPQRHPGFFWNSLKV